MTRAAATVSGDVRLVAVGPEFMTLGYALAALVALVVMLLVAMLVVLIGRR